MPRKTKFRGRVEGRLRVECGKFERVMGCVSRVRSWSAARGGCVVVSGYGMTAGGGMRGEDGLRDDGGCGTRAVCGGEGHRMGLKCGADGWGADGCGTGVPEPGVTNGVLEPGVTNRVGSFRGDYWARTGGTCVVPRSRRRTGPCGSGLRRGGSPAPWVTGVLFDVPNYRMSAA